MKFQIGDIVKYVGPTAGRINHGYVDKVIDVNVDSVLLAYSNSLRIDECLLVIAEKQTFNEGDKVRYIGSGYGSLKFGDEFTVSFKSPTYSDSYMMVEDNNRAYHSAYLELVSVPMKVSQKVKCDCDLYTVIMVNGCKNPNHY